MTLELKYWFLFTNFLRSRQLNPIKWIFLVVAVLNLFGCKNKQSSKNELVEAEFVVDTNLLDNSPYRDSLLNLEIKLPLNWNSLDSAAIQKLAAGILVGDYKNAQLEKSLINDLDSSMLLVLDITDLDDAIFEELKNNYSKSLNPDQRWSDVQFSEFKLNCFKLQQYVLQNKDMIHFKLVGYEKRDIKNKARFELWYFINRNNFDKEIKFVESSIGSLNCLIFKK